LPISLPTRRRLSQTVRVSDSGFVDEARDTAPGTADDAAPGATRDRAWRRRPSPAGTAFAVVVLGLVGFGLWAWGSRVHADDVAAYASLVGQVDAMDRMLTPLGHGEVPPCRDSEDGLVTRTYPPSTGPRAAELVGFLEQAGWVQQPSSLPVYAHLTRTAQGRLLTIDVLAPSDTSLVGSLSGRSPASSFGCLLH
jgi:hypothetical protein